MWSCGPIRFPLNFISSFQNPYWYLEGLSVHLWTKFVITQDVGWGEGAGISNPSGPHRHRPAQFFCRSTGFGNALLTQVSTGKPWRATPNTEITREWTGRHAAKSILTKSASWPLLCQGVILSHLHLTGKDSGYRIKTQTSSGKGWEGRGVLDCWQTLKAATPCLHSLSQLEPWAFVHHHEQDSTESPAKNLVSGLA